MDSNALKGVRFKALKVVNKAIKTAIERIETIALQKKTCTFVGQLLNER